MSASVPSMLAKATLLVLYLQVIPASPASTLTVNVLLVCVVVGTAELSEGAVKSLQHRALHSLRRIMTAEAR